MSTQPHQQRVIQEQADLGEKITKLDQFIHTSMFSALPMNDQELMVQQLHAMSVYNAILVWRIRRF